MQRNVANDCGIPFSLIPYLRKLLWKKFPFYCGGERKGSQIMELCEKLYIARDFGRAARRMYGICAAAVLLCVIFVGSEAGSVLFGSAKMSGTGVYETGSKALGGEDGRKIGAYAESDSETAGVLAETAKNAAAAVCENPGIAGVTLSGAAFGETDVSYRSAAETFRETDFPSMNYVYGEAGSAALPEDMTGGKAPAVPDKVVEIPSGNAADEKEDITADNPQDIPADIPAKPEDVPSDSGPSSGAEADILVVDGFYVDESGAICGIAEPEEIVKSGYMSLPSEGCSSVAAGAFDDIPAGIIEVYVPANITYIEEGAFSGLRDAEWFSADSSGTYTSLDGVLVSENGSCILAFPAGRTGIYRVPEEVVRIAPGAFAGSSLSKLDTRNSGVEDVGNIPETIEIL